MLKCDKRSADHSRSRRGNLVSASQRLLAAQAKIALAARDGVVEHELIADETRDSPHGQPDGIGV